jgi:hypothetical protein
MKKKESKNPEHIYSPFTDEQVKLLNDYQQIGIFHPFTCCGPEEIKECTRSSGESDGLLIATTKGWICPCGKYKQNWAHSWMVDPKVHEGFKKSPFYKNNNLKLEKNEKNEK